jgi:hypothetical protein
MQPRILEGGAIIRLKKLDQIIAFQNKFKNKHADRYKFLYYLQWMDIWILKIATQLQHLEETSSEYSIFIDSDSVITSSNHDEVVSDFIDPFIKSKKDIAFFQRPKTHLHPESGFIVFRKCDQLINAYREMLDFILDEKFYDLPSWTDCSVIDLFASSGKIEYFDFCSFYNLVSTNPVYESTLRKSMLHLKGPRKGAYSLLKKILGLYR